MVVKAFSQTLFAFFGGVFLSITTSFKKFYHFLGLSILFSSFISKLCPVLLSVLLSSFLFLDFINIAYHSQIFNDISYVIWMSKSQVICCLNDLPLIYPPLVISVSYLYICAYILSFIKSLLSDRIFFLISILYYTFWYITFN